MTPWTTDYVVETRAAYSNEPSVDHDRHSVLYRTDSTDSTWL